MRGHYRENTAATCPALLPGYDNECWEALREWDIREIARVEAVVAAAIASYTEESLPFVTASMGGLAGADVSASVLTFATAAVARTVGVAKVWAAAALVTSEAASAAERAAVMVLAVTVPASMVVAVAVASRLVALAAASSAAGAAASGASAAVAAWVGRFLLPEWRDRLLPATSSPSVSVWYRYRCIQ